MSALLIAMLSALILPRVTSRWRIAVAALGLQGLLMGLMMLQDHPLEYKAALPLADFILVRGVLLPLLLQRALRARARDWLGDAIPVTLLSLMIVVAMIVMAFVLARRLEPTGGVPQLQLAVAASALLLGLYQLATQVGVLSQAIGALTIENAIALFALEPGGTLSDLPVEIALLCVLIISIAIYAGYVERLSFVDVVRPEADAEELTL
jgi:hydrogenase-4 component E